MLLWNDYEGKTIAGSYPLAKLLRPEGRSAFFTTFNGTGTAAVIRLLESLNDEREILTRWRIVTEINQPHLLTMKSCGEDTVDGTPLLYAVLETTDANLADVLADRTLSVEETMQVATSLVPALQALHERNLVHEHIEPANVLAAGEIIKLRSDCIRDVPAGFEAYEAKTRDVHDLAVLLLQVRTMRKQLRDGDNSLLPAPLADIVRNGITGSWGLDEIAAALKLPPNSAAPSRKPAVAQPASATAPVAKATTAATTTPVTAPTPLKKQQSPTAISPASPVDVKKIAIWASVAVAVIAIFFLVSHYASNTSSAAPAAAIAQPANSPNTVVVPATPVTKPSATEPSSQTAASQTAPSRAARTDWRVIAYTYNHEAQAQSKANAIAAAHPMLHPEVFSPNGQPPYLVSLGGAMSREQAVALRQQARTAGLAGDTYIQNFAPRPR